MTLGIVITLICFALMAGYVGARIERKRSSSITKREATELRRDVEEIKLMFGEHWDTHKIIKYHIDRHAKEIDMIAAAAGFTRPEKLDG